MLELRRRIDASNPTSGALHSQNYPEVVTEAGAKSKIAACIELNKLRVSSTSFATYPDKANISPLIQCPPLRNPPTLEKLSFPAMDIIFISRRNWQRPALAAAWLAKWRLLFDNGCCPCLHCYLGPLSVNYSLVVPSLTLLYQAPFLLLTISLFPFEFMPIVLF